MPAVSLKPQIVVSASGPEKQNVTKPGAWRKLSSCFYVTMLATIYVLGSKTKIQVSHHQPHPTPPASIEVHIPKPDCIWKFLVNLPLSKVCEHH